MTALFRLSPILKSNSLIAVHPLLQVQAASQYRLFRKSDVRSDTPLSACRRLAFRLQVVP
jgi:hypothetical protein